MCLQLPPGSSITSEEDGNGVQAMSTLAEKLGEVGMVDVDTARLTARIAVIKFNCRVEINGSESMIECDISMQNPLAVINTALLHSYSVTTPCVRILAAIIKRWAKRRDINNPASHTLSSYGYILMLLHFLTTHKVTNNGTLESLFPSNKPQKTTECPYVPNLQWLDHRCLQKPDAPYTEWQQKPANSYTTMNHPTEASYIVNTHFFRINDQGAQSALKRKIDQFNTNTPSVGYLLASFFRYYAYDFDYKRHVVSLNALSRSGPIEREAKAESDGWKLYGQSLFLEDPFEEFYDVAHVLKPSNFQRIRRELALGYSKVLSSISKSSGSNNDDHGAGEKLLDSICEEFVDGA